MLRLGFDAKRLFHNHTGLGNYSRTLVQNLLYYYPDYAYFLYTPSIKKNEDTQVFLNSPAYSVHTPSPRQKPGWRTFGMHRQLKQHKIDLFHGLSNEIPLNLDKLPMKKVVTIHDLIFRRYPKQYPYIDRLGYHLKTSYACNNSDHIIAISECTKQDIIKYYQVAPEKISVLYQSCSEHFLQDKSQVLIDQVSDRYQLPKDYMLYVGSITERKNLLGILKAMTLLPKSMELPLVIVGGGKSYKKEVLAFMVKHKLKPYLYFIEPANEDLPFIYQKAQLFIYPSFFEGFGIPIIEALFSGTPVITSNCSSLPEAAGPGAILVDPKDPQQIADSIQQILQDPELRNELISKGYKYAQRFRGEALSKQLVSIYEQI